MFKAQCDQCYKEFEKESKQDARLSLQSHVNKTGHKSAVLAERVRSEEGAVVADAAVAEPTNIEDAKAAKAEKAAAAAAEKAAKAEAREAAKAEKAKIAEEKAAARAAAKAEREAPRTTPCECGCGAIPAGRKSRFLPGHDAKKASAEKQAAATA